MRHIDERRSIAQRGDDELFHHAPPAARRRGRSHAESGRGASGDEERDRGVDDVDGGGGKARQDRQIEARRGEPAEEQRDDRRARDRKPRDERDQDRGEAVRRQKAADEPPVRTEHFDNAGEPGKRAGEREGGETELRHLRALPDDHRRIAARRGRKERRKRCD